MGFAWVSYFIVVVVELEERFGGGLRGRADICTWTYLETSAKTCLFSKGEPDQKVFIFIAFIRPREDRSKLRFNQPRSEIEMNSTRKYTSSMQN